MKRFNRSGEPASIDNIYRLDGRVPLGKAVFIGIQHVLAMFVGNIAMVIILSGVAVYSGEPLTILQQTSMIQNCMIIAGIASLIQLYPIMRVGSGLPIIMGISFSFFAVAMAQASQDYGVMIGSVIAGGCVEGLLGLTAKYWGKYIRSIVSACVVLSMGISLLPTSVTYFGTSDVYSFCSWQNLLVALVTMTVCLLFQIFGRGIWKQLNVLAGIVIGYVFSIFFGMVNFDTLSSTISEMGLVAIPRLFTYTPKFQIGAILSFVLIFIVSATETIGATNALCTSALKREPTSREISGSLCVDGFFSAISGGVFGCPPITSYSQNVGLVSMTGIVNRYSIMFGMLTLVLAGLFPPISAVFSTLPYCVLGGCTVMMFGSVIVAGIDMVRDAGSSQKNTLVVSISLGLGVGSNMVDGFYAFMPGWVREIFEGNIVAGVFVVALLLDLILPDKIGRDRVEAADKTAVH